MGKVKEEELLNKGEEDGAGYVCSECDKLFKSPRA